MSEILVSTDFGSGGPVIGGFSTGFVVVWANTGNQDLNAARFDASGTKQDEFVVNTTKGIFGLPAIDRAGEGFVVTWITSSPPARVLLQRYDDSGRKAGPEIVVSSDNVVTDLERIRAPVVAFLESGNFVISWVAALPTIQVRAAIFNGFDGGRKGGEFTVNTSAGIHFAPAIAAFRGVGSDDVAFVVSWTGGDNGILLNRFQLFDETSKKLGLEIMPNHSIGAIAPAAFANNDPREFIGVLGGINGDQEQVLACRRKTSSATMSWRPFSKSCPGRRISFNSSPASPRSTPTPAPAKIRYPPCRWWTMPEAFTSPSPGWTRRSTARSRRSRHGCFRER